MNKDIEILIAKLNKILAISENVIDKKDFLVNFANQLWHENSSNIDNSGYWTNNLDIKQTGIYKKAKAFEQAR